MRPLVNSGSFSPKSANHSTSGSHISEDGLECPSASPSRFQGKKRERENESLEVMKRATKSTSILKPDIAKLIERGELVNSEAVDKMVQLMHTEKIEKKMDFVCRSKIAGAIASTSKFECLSQFVQLRGVCIFDEWLQEVHKGKTGDGNSPKEVDKPIEEFLLVLLNALGKLPVNLHDLRMSNIGKSVNMLRSHKNTDVQKKARRLVDLWKKRVEAELVHSSAKAGYTEDAIVSAKLPASGGSQCGKTSPCENPPINRSSIEINSVKNELETRAFLTVAKSASDSISFSKSALIQKDSQHETAVGDGGSNAPLSSHGDDKSCSSSLSHTSHSCSSDQINNVISPEKEHSRCSSSGSMSNKLVSKNESRDKKLLSEMLGPAFPGIHKERRSKRSTLSRNKPTKKVSHSEISNEKENKQAISSEHSHKLIVKFPNRICGPVKSTTGSPPDEASLMSCKPVYSDCISKRNSEVWKHHVDSEVITESWQSNESMDILNVSDEGEGSLATTVDKENNKNLGGGMNVTEVSKDISPSSLVREEIDIIHEGSTKSLTVLIESCEESEILTSVTPGDDVGMTLLANVATCDMLKCDMSGRSNAPVSTLVKGNSVGSVCLSANVDKNVQEPLVHTEQINEDIEKQVEAGATLAILRNNASVFMPVNDNLSRDPSSSTMQVEHTASLVTSSTETVTDEIVVGQNKSTVVEDETGEIFDKSVAKLSISNGENILENAMDDTNGHIVVNVALNGDGSPSATVSNAMKEHEGSVSLLKESGKNNWTGKSAEIQPSKSDKAMCQVSNQINCIKQRAEQIDQERMDICDENFKMDNNPLSVYVGTNTECVMQIENQDASKHHNKIKYLGDSTCQLDTRNEVKECESTNTDVAPAASGLHSQTKFMFDLNESCDDGENVPGSPSETLPISSAATWKNLMSYTASGGFPVSVTAVAAAKGPFNPPGDLIKSKGEVGWKGSAATSAFRVVEPRRAITIQSSIISSSVADISTNKETQPFLDIDLNVAHVGSPEDAPFGSVLQYTNMSEKCADSSGFDLNLFDPDIFMGQISAGKDYKPGFPHFLSKMAGNIPAGPSKNQRGFDLNSCLDEVTTDVSRFSERNSLQSQLPVTGLKMKSMGTANMSSWFPGHAVSTQISSFSEKSSVQSQLPLTGNKMNYVGTSNMSPLFLGNTVSTYNIPSFGTALNHPISTTAAGEQQRFISISNGLPTLAPGGPILTSSPAPSFYSSFQHANFPCGTGFPMPSAPFSGGTVFVDSSSGRRHCVVPGQSHPSGPVNTVCSNYYPRPCLVSLSDGCNNNSGQPWDLDAGPLGLETGRSDSTFPVGMSQLSFANARPLPVNQARMYQAAGTVMRNRAPKGNWYAEK